MEQVIASKELQIERKRIVIEFRENARGRFLRIIEEVHGRRNMIIVPSTGLNDFMGAADEVCTAANQASPV
jgi:hypothetical protein